MPTTRNLRASVFSYVLVGAAASLGLAGCSDESSASPAEQYAALCDQLDAKEAACAEAAFLIYDCYDVFVPAACLSQMTALASCYTTATVDICGTAGASACESRVAAVSQCVNTTCAATPTDPACM